MRRPLLTLLAVVLLAPALPAQRTAKPPLHGRHWMAITGKPLGAAAGARIFAQGGNAVDAAVAMLGAVATMWDVLSWGGETQALIYHPGLKKVIGINALGWAPSGATPEYFAAKGLSNPPEYGVDAAVTPGTPGGIMVMLAEYGTMTLAQVLQPAIEMADGYPIEAATANSIEAQKRRLREWPYSRTTMLPHLGMEREAPEPGEIFRQPDLAAMLRSLVATEQQARRAGKNRREAIMAAYDRFYTGDIASEYVRGAREQGSPVTMEDLATWRVRIEEPVSTTYKGIEVYKLNVWTQGPALLQALNILEQARVQEMGYNSARYLHTIYQAMSMAFADRDFYYGDIYTAPEEPVRGLLSKEYARQRFGQINWDRNDPLVRPGDPYPFQGGTNPFGRLLADWSVTGPRPDSGRVAAPADDAAFREAFYAGTTSIQAADSCRLGGEHHAERWVGAGGDRRPDRYRHEPAGAELRAPGRGRTLQRRGASEATAGDADAVARPQGWRAVPELCGAGGGLPGSEPAPVLPQHGGVRDDGAGGHRGGQPQQLPDAHQLWRSRQPPRADAAGRERSRVGAHRPAPDGLYAGVPTADERTDQRDLVRSKTPHAVGRVFELRRGLRDRVGVRGER